MASLSSRTSEEEAGSDWDTEALGVGGAFDGIDDGDAGAEMSTSLSRLSSSICRHKSGPLLGVAGDGGEGGGIVGACWSCPRTYTALLCTGPAILTDVDVVPLFMTDDGKKAGADVISCLDLGVIWKMC